MAVDNNDAAKKARLKSVLLLMLPLVALGVIVKYRYVPEAERVRLAPDRHVTAKLDAILSSNASDAARRKALIEFGYTSAEFENALRKRFPDAMMVDRVSSYVQICHFFRDGKLGLKLAIKIPFFVEIEISYEHDRKQRR